jgi:hypothetical protein
MVVIEVDCFRRIEAGIPLPDDDLVAKGMTPAQIHAERLARVAEARSGPGFTSFLNEHLPSIQPEDFYSISDDVFVRRLSTITERTEKTELTEAPTRTSRSLAYINRHSLHAPSATPTDSSYGEVIGKLHLNGSTGLSCLYHSFCAGRISSKSGDLARRSEFHTAVTAPVCFATVS